MSEEKNKFILFSTADGYFIGTYVKKRDSQIANTIIMTEQDYQCYLIDNFNGFILRYIGDVYFKLESDAIKALNWVESMYIMNCLTKEN